MLNFIWGIMIVLGIAVALVRIMLPGGPEVAELTDAFFKSASLSVEIIIGLMGMMCLWMGVSSIIEQSGLANKLAKLLTPLFRVIMPEIPAGHKAVSDITMNLSANMLGLDNAATPLGLKAMRSLEELNPHPGTATNSEIMFLVINTSAVTIFPISIILYRTKFGAACPTDIFLPILITTTISTLASFLAVAFCQKINLLKLPLFVAFGLLFAVAAGISVWAVYAGDTLASQATGFSNVLIMAFVAAVVLWGMIKKVPVFAAFISGAKEGIKVSFDILPYLVAMLSAIAVFKASGIMGLLISAIKSVCAFLGLRGDFAEAVPVGLMNPLSGSGGRALMLDVFETYGPDSLAGHIASMMQGSTETTFYVIAVYFGAVGITKVRHAIGCGLFADFAAMMAAIFVGLMFFG